MALCRIGQVVGSKNLLTVVCGTRGRQQLMSLVPSISWFGFAGPAGGLSKATSLHPRRACGLDTVCVLRVSWRCRRVQCGRGGQDRKKITKPVATWCVGTGASAFSYDVQFGHAGSQARGDTKKAVSKNTAMKEAGIVVPETSTTCGDKVHKCSHDWLHQEI